MIIAQPKVTFATFKISDIPANPEPFRLINKIPIHDNGEKLVDLRLTNPELSFSDFCLPYVRESIAEALKIAYSNVPSHLELRIGTGLRTHEQQARMYWSNYEKAKEEHPNWPKSVLRKMTNRFFAPPDVKAPPGHCTGGAIDVGLLNRETGEGLDVSSPIEHWHAAPTATEGLSPEASENRRLLCFVMYITGLSNCRDEYWHWSYGDSAWSIRAEEPISCYGLIPPPDGATRVVGPKVEILPWNPDYVQQFADFKDVFVNKLGPKVKSVNLVGSTSVPKMPGNSILDIDLVVGRDEMIPIVAELKELGYQNLEENKIEGRETFRSWGNDAPKDGSERKWPAHRLTAYIEGSIEIKRRTAFKDYLQTHPSAAESYVNLRKGLAAKYPWDRTRYDEGKLEFVNEILKSR